MPWYTWQAIKEPLDAAVKYGSSGSIVQLRVHNYCEPFKEPALRTEVLGVTPDGRETVLCRYEEEEAGSDFSNEVFDVPQVFTYIGKNSKITRNLGQWFICQVLLILVHIGVIKVLGRKGYISCFLFSRRDRIILLFQ